MEQFLRYKLVKEIGSGGMARVFLAKDAVLNRNVAIKMVHPHLLDRPEMLRRFNTEAQSVASVSHENVVKIFDYGEADGKRYIVMEFIDGITLLDLHEKNPVIPNLVLIGILQQILSGLIVVHDKKIIHRDIKPGNIMIDKHGCVRIMDFGIAYLLNQESITMTGTFIGSPSHISPEQAEGLPVSGKTDIFSLGAMSYECATGVHPFAAENAQVTIHRVLNHKPEPPLKHNGGIVLAFSDLIEELLLKDVTLRPDAALCLEKLGGLCKKNGIHPERNRILEFISNPVQYAQKERSELFQHYKSRAVIDLKSGRVPSGMRNLNQARSFGLLDTDEQKYINSFSRKRKLSAVLLGVAIVSLLFSMSYVVWNFRGRAFFKSHAISGSQKAVSRPVSVFLNDSAIALNKKSDKEIVSSISSEPEKKSEQISVKSERVFSAVKHVSKKSAVPTVSRKISEPDVFEQKNEIAAEKTEAAAIENIKTQFGFLEIVTSPPWVNVSIDNNHWGQTPKLQVVPLSAGVHSVQLHKDGFETFSERIVISESDTLRKRIRLKQSSQ